MDHTQALASSRSWTPSAIRARNFRLADCLQLCIDARSSGSRSLLWAKVVYRSLSASIS
jgi:hypothetical protein